MRNAFHHAAVAREGVGEVVNDVVAGRLNCAAGLLCNRHTYGVSDALTQRTGSGFNASGVAHFRVTQVLECS